MDRSHSTDLRRVDVNRAEVVGTIHSAHPRGDAQHIVVRSGQTWWRIALYGRNASIRLAPGDTVRVAGSLQVRTWTDSDGRKAPTVELIAGVVDLLSPTEPRQLVRISGTIVTDPWMTDRAAWLTIKVRDRARRGGRRCFSVATFETAAVEVVKAVTRCDRVLVVGELRQLTGRTRIVAARVERLEPLPARDAVPVPDRASP